MRVQLRERAFGATEPCPVEPWPPSRTVDTIAAVQARGDGSRDRRTAAPVDDLQLAARLVAGDQSALADAYERYVGLVYGLARRVVGHDAMAEEVTQEVFVHLWEHPGKFDPARGSMRSWLGLLAHRRSVDRVRSEVRRSATEARVEPVVTAATANDEVDDELSRAWLAGCVRAALDQLPTDQRDAVVLAYFGGRTYRQVATELSIPEGTAKSRLRLALAKLEDVLRATITEQDAPAWT